jgi:hypothetical protein
MRVLLCDVVMCVMHMYTIVTMLLYVMLAL